MKRFWSLIIAVVMLFTVFALVSCEKEPEQTSEATTTAATTTVEPTTQATTEATTKATTEATTTEATTTEATTTAETTPAETTPAETTAPEETTTPEATLGTTIPLYARFDFGTDSYAVQNGLTAHEFLMDCLTYDKGYLYIDVKEDSWKIWVMASYVKDETPATAYALKFDPIITYDYEFPDEGLYPGWGTWSKAPYTTANVGKSWVGRHQYMKIRLINNTKNNMIGFWWSASNNPNYFTTLRCSNLYLQGDRGSKTCTATDKYASYIYDICFTNALASNRFGWSSGEVVVDDIGTKKAQESWCNTATFAEFMAAAKRPENIGLIGANNWCGGGVESVGIQFFLFGAVDTGDSGNANCDSRDSAVQGTWVEVDYILFGSTVDQLEAYKSNIEKAAK